MRFIKRLFFVVILLVIAFFVYRLISPIAAKNLIYDLKSFSNTSIGTHFSLSGEILDDTGVVLDMTGIFLEETGALQELTGDEELLLRDDDLREDLATGTTTTGVTLVSTGALSTGSLVTTSAPPVVPLQTPTLPKKKSTTSSSSRDLDRFLQKFGN